MAYTDDLLADGAALVWDFQDSVTAGSDTFVALNDGTHSSTLTEYNSNTSAAAATALFGDETDTKALSVGDGASVNIRDTSANLGTGSGSVSVEAVFRPETQTGPQPGNAVIKLYTQVGGDEYNFGIEYDRSTTEFIGTLHYYEPFGAEYNNQIRVTKAVGTTYHVALVFDTTANTLTFYVDGVQEGQISGGDVTNFGDWPFNNSTFITVASGTDHADGSIQAPAVYRHALSVSDIGDHVTTVSAPPISQAVEAITLTATETAIIDPVKVVTESVTLTESNDGKVNWIEFQPVVLVEWSGYQTYQPIVPVEWQLETATPVVPIQWVVTESYQPIIPIEWSGVDMTGYPATAENWSLSVIIDGTDYSDRLTGRVEIDYEEDSSGMASFQIVPSAGAIDPLSWLSKIVTIDVTSGSNTVRRFNGLISNATYDPETRLMAFDCTTDLQGYFENLDRDTIDDMVGGYWSANIFNDDSDGWTYAQDRLATQYVSIHQDQNRQPVITSLSAKGTPDFTFTDDKRFNETLSITRATRRELINRIRVRIDYRFTKLRQRHIKYSFEWVRDVGGTGNALSWCDFLGNQYDPCNRSQIESAIGSSGWNLLGSVDYTPLNDSGNFECPGYFNPNASQAGDQFGWVVSDAVLDSTCLEARFTLAKRFAQTVTESYSFDVRADNSIEYAGELSLDQKFAVDNESDSADWESNDAYSTTAPGAVQDSSGDYVIDLTTGDNDRTAFENAQQTALAQATTSIKKSHRGNVVSFEVPFHAEINLTHTAQVTCPYLDAKGKVIQRVDTFDTETGEAVTSLSLAISAHGGSGLVTETPLTPITATQTDLPSYTTSYALHYLIGGDNQTQPYDETKPGYYTNRETVTGAYERYDNNFALNTPEVASAYRDAITVTESKTINVDVEEDTLTLSA